MITWLLRRWKGAGLALVLLLGALRLWWERRQSQRAIAAQAARADRAELELEREAGRADVAEARARVTADHATETAAAELAAERIEDVPVTDDPAADRARLYDALRVLPGTDDDHRP